MDKLELQAEIIGYNNLFQDKQFMFNIGDKTYHEMWEINLQDQGLL